MRQYGTETKLCVNDSLMWNERTTDKALIELFSTSYFRYQTQLNSIVLAKHFCGVGIDSLLKTCSLVLEYVGRFRVERSMGTLWEVSPKRWISRYMHLTEPSQITSS